MISVSHLDEGLKSACGKATVPATHEVLVIAATASVSRRRRVVGVLRDRQIFGTIWGAEVVPQLLAALFCTLLLLVAAAVVVAVYIEDRQY